MFLSLPLRWLASFQILRFAVAVLSLGSRSPTRLLHSAKVTVRVGGLDVVLGGPLHQDCSALTGCCSLNKRFRLLLASCFQEEQSESVLCVKCVRTEGVFKPAKCLCWEGCLPEGESHFASAPFQLQLSSLNGPDYRPPYGMCLCHFWTATFALPHIWDYRIRFSKTDLKKDFFFKSWPLAFCRKPAQQLFVYPVLWLFLHIINEWCVITSLPGKQRAEFPCRVFLGGMLY